MTTEEKKAGAVVSGDPMPGIAARLKQNVGPFPTSKEQFDFYTDHVSQMVELYGQPFIDFVDKCLRRFNAGDWTDFSESERDWCDFTLKELGWVTGSYWDETSTEMISIHRDVDGTVIVALSMRPLAALIP